MKKSTTYGDPLVSQLGHGLTRTSHFLFGPTYYNMSDESSPIKSFNNNDVLRGGAKTSERYIHLTILHNNF
jgi:hypothetical protein